MNRRSRPGPLLLVLTTIVLQLAVAWLLGSVASSAPHYTLKLAAVAVAGAIGLNLLRFVVWGYAHRLYPLSQTYPLTALFFPCVLLLSYFHGDPVSIRQIIGTLLITTGALTLGTSSQRKRPDPLNDPIHPRKVRVFHDH